MIGQAGGFHALMYHEIVPEPGLPNGGREISVADGYRDLLPDRLFVAREAFEEQMRWLMKHGYVSIRLAEVKAFYLHRTPLPERGVLLCFDDLYQSVKQHAYPVLRELGFHAVGFVVSDWIFPSPQPPSCDHSVTLSWPELEDMRDVFEYAHHSAGLHTRGKAGSALQMATMGEIRNDLARGAEGLDEPDVYAFPFGTYSQEIVRTLGEAGVTLAFTTQSGYNDADTLQRELHRTGVFRATSLREFEISVSRRR